MMDEFVQSVERPPFVPSEGQLAFHNLHEAFTNLADFQPQLPVLLRQGTRIEDLIQLTHALGILEPFTGKHILPEAIEIQGPNFRESLVANGLLSRNRAMLRVLERRHSSLEQLRQQDIYLVEALTGFAVWLQRQLGKERLICSEYLKDTGHGFSDIPHQDLCALTFANSCIDLVLCNELFEHVQDLDQAFREIARVLRPGGRLVATCPMAFGQHDSIVKAIHNPETGEAELLGEAEFHGDPIRPEQGSLVYRIPGWELLDQLKAAGFSNSVIHHEVAWKHGVLGSDLPGVLVIEAQR